MAENIGIFEGADTKEYGSQASYQTYFRSMQSGFHEQCR